MSDASTQVLFMEVERNMAWSLSREGVHHWNRLGVRCPTCKGLCRDEWTGEPLGKRVARVVASQRRRRHR